MELDVADTHTTIDVSDNAFGRDFNETLIHQAVTAYLAGGRGANKILKGRSAVRGGGAKPWRQKGTGRARAGTIRSPLWRGGGVTFGNAQQNFQHKINKKMYRSAMRSIISELARQKRLIVLESFAVKSLKTKDLLTRLDGFAYDSLLILTANEDENLYLAARNLRNVDVMQVKHLNPVSLIRFDKVLVTVDAIKRIEEWLS
jgi:large subunit ribosomal protein L4